MSKTNDDLDQLYKVGFTSMGCSLVFLFVMVSIVALVGYLLGVR